MTPNRLLLAALVIAAAVLAVSPCRVMAAAPQAEPAAAHPQESPAAQEAAGEEHPAAGGWRATIAKMVNFAILAGVLVYFLRAPLMSYLDGRIGKVREDLVTAAQTRDAASRQLAEIDARLRALPTEIEALKARGAEDLAAERVRIAQAAEAERQRLLEQTRREIEMRLRVARRELVELTADLAVRVAADRIERSITPDDQSRLLDRYASQLRRSAP
jgi:F-type H+-transporting ATPase subunit b